MKQGENEQIKGLEKLFIEVIDQEGGDAYSNFFSTRSREGIFSPALTMWLMVCQRTQERHALVGALESAAEGHCDQILARNFESKRARRGDLSLNSGGLSRARSKLKVVEVQAVAELVASHLKKKYAPAKRWQDKPVYIMDGTLIALGTGEIIRETYPGSKSSRESNTGLLLCMCFHDLFSGMAVSPHWGSYAGKEVASEKQLSIEIIGELKESALLIGDRNFGIFSVAYEADRCEHEVLLRLTKQRVKNVRGKPLGTRDVDEEVTWHPGVETHKRNPELPADAAVKGRFVQVTVRNPGCKKLTLYFFTTSKASVKELTELYKQRERIENDIRSLKHTVGLEMFYAQSPEMIEKELLLAFAAYNLMRALIAWGAKKLKVAPRDISFSRGAALTRIFGNKMRNAQTQKEQSEITKRYLIGLQQSKLSKRKTTRSEPRKVARKRAQFPLMKTTREEERELAKRCLRNNGHRGYTTTRPSRY